MRFAALVLLVAALLLFGCASNGTNMLADAPAWLGGEPAGIPPRPGTPAYEAWRAQRDQEVLRPKSKGESNSTATVD
jgi:hypothetical protein